MSGGGRVRLALVDNAWRAFAVIALLVTWEIAVGAGVIRELWVSQPSQIWSWIVAEVPTAEFMGHLWITTKETLLGLAIGAATGVLAGFLLSLSRGLYRTAEPLIMVAYSLPRIALAPLFIVWFGIGEASKVALAVSLVFFVMLFNAYEGVRGVSQDLVNSVRTMGGSRFFLYRRVVAPAAMPFLVAGLRVSIGLALIGVIVGEMLASRSGLGHVLSLGASLFQTEVIFGVIAVLAVMALMANTLMGWLERRLLAWRVEGRT